MPKHKAKGLVSEGLERDLRKTKFKFSLPATSKLLTPNFDSTQLFNYYRLFTGGLF